MTINERIFSCFDKKSGKTPATLAKILGLANSQMTMWKQRGTDPQAKYIIQIAEYLEVPIYWLLTGEYEQQDNKLSQEAITIASIYDKLNDQGKRMIDAVAQLEIERSTEAEQATDTIINAAIQARSEIDAEESV